MSINSEFSQQIDTKNDEFSASTPGAESGNGHRPRFDLRAYASGERTKLVQRLFLMPGAESARMVLFCGVGAEDGSSLVCARTAATLASQVEASVCMVDANWRFPSLHKCLQTYNHSGLSDAVLRLGCMRNVARQLDGGNLWLVTSGSHVGDPHTLLTSESLPSRLAELKTDFNYVLIDGPPVNPYGDAMMLGKFVDGVVLMLQANSTRREVARKAMASLQSAGVRLFGAVLNKRSFPIPEFLYNRI